MKGSSFTYLLKEGARNIWVNRMMSLASVGILVSCMLLIGSAILLSINLNGMVSYVENQNEMVAFLEDTADDNVVASVEAALAQNSNVDSFAFVSREEALERYSEVVPESLLESLQEDKEEVFPLSFRITLKDLSQIKETTARIESIPGVMRVNAPTNVAETVTGIKRAVYICGSGIVVILLAVTLIIIANTIKVTVFNRRKEINIMKFVGATDLFIRMPFVVEGILLGVISACAAYLLLWGGYTYLMDYVQTQAAGTLSAFLKNLVPFSQVARQLLASFLVGGVAIGVFGSMIFVRKHLKV
ncbi:MAG: permease-like cell division protein FtsX [Oscillospiraceae bacterium]|nr:permease-like cell division protein FtsX [Oscillospiraceae bacterium]